VQTKVFVPHPVLVRTESGMRWKFDIERVTRVYGAIRPLMADSTAMLTPSVAAEIIRKALIAEDFAPQRDYFLAAGDPTAYGLAMAVAVREYGVTPRQLRHNRRTDEYDVLPRLDWTTEGEVSCVNAN